MTREEAANVLRSTWLNAGRVNGKTVFAEALNMAIRALETQPDGDAVSRKDAIRIVDSIDTWQAGWRGNAIESLKALPPAQPDLSSYSDKLWRNAYERGKAEAQAEIVRCKDCKHFIKDHGWNRIEYTVCSISPIHKVIRQPDDFCSKAERRTDEA